MLGFGKKKKKKKEKQEEDISLNDALPKKEDEKPSSEEPEKKKKQKKKKRFSIKMILFILLIFIAIGGSAYVVYTLYFSKSSSAAEKKAAYKKVMLEHVTLPEEMLKFSFEYFPDLYAAMLTYNAEIKLIDKEILRIEEIAHTYPDQGKIAAKEKKIWEKSKAALQKGFLKIEKPVKETYVLFRVNEAAGLTQIEAKYPELTESATAILIPAQEMTEKLKSKEQIPEGLIKGNIYKFKKKFL